MEPAQVSSSYDSGVKFRSCDKKWSYAVYLHFSQLYVSILIFVIRNISFTLFPGSNGLPKDGLP